MTAPQAPLHASRLVAIVMLVGSCTSSSQGEQPRVELTDRTDIQGTQLAGEWNLAALHALRTLRQALFMTITIDSVRGESFFGRVTHYMAGNVGADILRLAPFEGRLEADRTASFTVNARGDDRFTLEIEGTLNLSVDTLSLQQFRIAGDDWTTGRRRWALVRVGD